MAKNTLPVDFQDDIMNSSMGGKRRFKMINNSDGTVSFEDATTYDQVGSNFGAGQINATNQAVNESFDKNKIVRDLETIGAITEEGYVPDALALKEVNESLGGLRFGTDGEGNYGYFGADDSLIPFKKGVPQYIGAVWSTAQTYNSFYCDNNTNSIISNYVGGIWLSNNDFKLGLIGGIEQCIANVNGTFKVINFGTETIHEQYFNAGDTIFQFGRNSNVKMVFKIS